MTEPFERLNLARHAAGFKNATEAANHFKFNENTYRSHENGERGIRPKVAKAYAEAFKISISWLLTGEGNPRGNNHVPVVACVAHNGLITHVAGLDYVSSTVNRLMNTISSSLIVPERCLAFYVRHDVGGKYQSGSMLLSWSRQKYDENYMVDGILWINEREAGLQIASQKLNGRLHIQHRFGPEEVREGAFFDPVQAIILNGNYQWLEDETADRWVNRAE